MRAEQERVPCGLLRRPNGVDALLGKLRDHAGVMDERAERVHGAGVLLGGGLDHLQGSLDAVAGAGLLGDADLGRADCHLVHPRVVPAKLVTERIDALHAQALHLGELLLALLDVQVGPLDGLVGAHVHAMAEA